MGFAHLHAFSKKSGCQLRPGIFGPLLIWEKLGGNRGTYGGDFSLGYFFQDGDKLVRPHLGKGRSDPHFFLRKLPK